MRYQDKVFKFINDFHINFLSSMVVTFLFLIIINCTNNDTLSGGTTIGNPHTVSGIIVDSIGKGIPNVRVNLLPVKFNPLSDLEPDNFAITGEQGEYEINNIYNGEYILNGIYDQCQKRTYVNVLIDGNDENLGIDTIKATGIISVHLSAQYYGTGRFLYIPGTELYTAVTDTGYINVISPEGRVNLAYFDTSDGGSIITEGPNYTYIPVKMNDTIIINDHEITLADKPEGPTAPLVGDSCTYLIRNAQTSLLHPIEYRFRYIEYVSTPDDWWINSDTTSWSMNSSITIIWPKAAEFKIQAQVRSMMDTTVISTFYPTSNFLKVIVTDTL